jgi:HEAT repeat protein
MLVIVAPLRLTFWVLVIGAAVILALMATGVSRHLARARDARVRERLLGQLEPVFSRFLESTDWERLAQELRPAFLRMDRAERPVAALLTIDLIQAASWSQKEQVRSALEEAGIVELGERGTRRFSPWRRALACEALGKIGAPHAVPALLARLKDRRPEVRMAAVLALGEIGSAEAVPALSEAFLQRRVAPTNIVSYALTKIGGDAAPAFERGVASPDPIVRVSSCYGLSAIASSHGGAVYRLCEVLASDSDAGVRAAAAAALGIAGGGKAPAALMSAADDSDVRVRRAAVKALGSFDDPTTAETLDKRTEDEDREVAIRAGEALITLTRRPRAAAEAQVRVESSTAWAVSYARKVAEVVEDASKVAEVSA